MKQTIIIFILCFSYLTNFAQEQWELAKEKDGITVFTRDKEGYDIKEFKAEVIVNGADFEKICAVLLESDSGELWIADIKDAKLLKRHSLTKTTSYFELKLPWPIEARDMVVDNLVEKKDSSLFINLQGNPEGFPKQEGMVRMTQIEGSWNIKKLPDNSISIFYTFIGDPAGSIPTWVINMFIVEGPLTSISNLIERAKK
jgi:hypothetical protein